MDIIKRIILTIVIAPFALIYLLLDGIRKWFRGFGNLWGIDKIVERDMIKHVKDIDDL